MFDSHIFCSSTLKTEAFRKIKHAIIAELNYRNWFKALCHAHHHRIFCLVVIPVCVSKHVFNNPANIYLFRVNNINTRKSCKICSKITIRTPEQHQWRRSGVFIVNFEYISQFFLVFPLLASKCKHGNAILCLGQNLHYMGLKQNVLPEKVEHHSIRKRSIMYYNQSPHGKCFYQ